MNGLWMFAAAFFLTMSKAFANPACIVCTVAIGASLEIARKMGISDEVVGLWMGAFLALLGYWAIFWFDKKKWFFKGRDVLLMILSLSMAGFVYWKNMIWRPVVFGVLDPFFVSCLGGAMVFILSQKGYAYLKMKNNGHAHFPFEKVVLPVAFLFLFSVVLEYYA